jgi:predicted DNA-binding transcriptional regulator YafY
MWATLNASAQAPAKKRPARRAAGAKKERGVKVGLDRFKKIVRLGNRRTGVTMEELKRELDVSKASVTRDIEFLRNRMGCPIHWDAQQHRYFINKLPDGQRFELPGLWFDASEVFALLMMVNLMEGIEPGFVLVDLSPMTERLKAILAAGGKSAPELESKVKLIHFAPRKVEPAYFQTVATALLDGKRLALHYLRRDKQQRTEREISPLQLVHYRENWVLDAWCHMRNDLRSFAVEAIEGVSVVDKPAKKVSRDEMREHFQSGYGIFAGKAIHRAVMKFTAKRAQWVSLESWHPNQSSRWEHDGSFILEVPYSNDEELVMDLMRYGSDVEVLGPPELREHVHHALSAAAKQYAK